MNRVRLMDAAYEDKTVIRNLMQCYLHDMSAFGGFGPNQHGIFEYRFLDLYWTADGIAEGRAPFLIWIGDDLGGFALKHHWSVVDGAPVVNTVAEFFVLGMWRRRGVGRAAATALFDRFPGRWEVRELRANLPAQRFWRSVIDGYAAGAYHEIDLQNAAWDGPVQVFTANEANRLSPHT